MKLRKATAKSTGKEVNNLADLPVGNSGTVVEFNPSCRGKKKFADVGIVNGSELAVEGYAPFGGLMRIKVLGSSLSVHSSDAKDIIVRNNGAKK